MIRCASLLSFDNSFSDKLSLFSAACARLSSLEMLSYTYQPAPEIASAIVSDTAAIFRFFIVSMATNVDLVGPNV